MFLASPFTNAFLHRLASARRVPGGGFFHKVRRYTPRHTKIPISRVGLWTSVTVVYHTKFTTQVPASVYEIANPDRSWALLTVSWW